MKLQIKLGILIFIAFTFSGTNSYAERYMAVQHEKPTFHRICPDGWEIASGTPSAAHTCKPKKPTPIKCPKGMTYFESDCLVGCAILPK